MPTNTFRPLFTQLSANTSAFGDSAGKSECHMSRSGGYNVTGFGGFTSDASWTRRMVLTKEGALVVLDAISPGASTQLKAGWVGLPIWQLNCNCSKNATPTVCAPMAGKPDAFDLKHFERTTDQWQRSLAHDGPVAALPRAQRRQVRRGRQPASQVRLRAGAHLRRRARVQRTG